MMERESARGLVLALSSICLILMLQISGNDAVLSLTATTASIAENSAVDTKVADLQGQGGTSSPTYTYAIQGTSPDFKISSAELQVKANGNLNFESGSNSIAIVILLSSDNGADAAVNVTFTVTVTDVNEPPTFIMDSYGWTVANYAMAGTVIGTVNATDVDAGNNGNVQYSITAGNTGSVFAVGQTDGMIKVDTNKKVNSTVQAAYGLTITATDGGSLTDTAMVYIAICTASGVAQLTGSLVGVVSVLILTVTNTFLL